jgi:hypothetical protein
MTPTATHCVRRLRFRGRIASPRLARQRVEIALANSADASRLGNETILCVRRLTVSLPRIDRLADAFDAELMAAARPAGGFVPANTNAVLFADRAELLACLARDWCIGEAANRWWWPALFPREDFAAMVRRTWLEDARPVPAALARLDSVGLSAPFLARLSPPDIAALRRNIASAFHLPHLDAAWRAVDIFAIDSVGAGVPRDAPPWSPWVNFPFSLSPEAARILITALLLERAPAVVRSVSFTQMIHKWADRTHAVRATAPTKKTAINGQSSPKTTSHTDLRPSNLSHWSKTSDARSKQTAPPKSLNGAPPVDTAHQDLPSLSELSPVGDVSTDSQSQIYRAITRDRPVDRASPPNATANDTQIALPGSHDYDRIKTEWGGVFYLVNVAIVLGVYGDFTMPARPGLALPVWDYLTLTAGRMIGNAFAADPLSTLFAKLSGRNGEEPPGAYFEPDGGESLADWVERNCHEIDQRLVSALAINDPETLHTVVLNHIARVETGALRLDVHFSLATHPIELRIAGLDRDPGWVPAAGRSIYFHYD